jgi:hypothetical protein
MAKLPRKRCCICRRGFCPDPRVGERQRACGRAECQKARRAQTQAAWRARNPDYFRELRFQKRWADAKAAQRPVGSVAAGRHAEATEGAVRAPPLLRIPPELRRIPWDLAQAEIGVAPTDLLLLVGCMVLTSVQGQTRPVTGSTA